MEPLESTTARQRGQFDALDRALDVLTGAQRAAVLAPAPALCIVAGAGSGKTRVLTLRAARRIRDGSAEADHTAVCTFTRKAARELRSRLELYGVPVSTPAPPGGAPGPGVRAGTLHQLGLTLLRRRANDLGQPPPTVAEHRFRTVRDLVADPSTASEVDTEIAWAKARCLAPDRYADAANRAGRHTTLSSDEVGDVFAAYQQALGRRRSLDLDDVLVHAADLLHDDPDFAERMRWRYRHLSVDEFQDVNPAQFRLISAVMGDRFDLCAVGDPNQAIYGWNGADPTLLARLPEVVPHMEVIRLDENHRSTPQVVAAATAALGPAAVVPPRSSRIDGPMPLVTAYEDDAAEAEGVIALLIDRVDDGSRWSEHAVLARTHDQLAAVARAMTRIGVPYRMAPAPEAPSDDPAGGTTPNIEADRGLPAVELATFHRAKGLEWPSVYVLGLEEGFVPIIYAETSEARAEERRLLYVALTRATDNLHCSWARVRRMANGRQMERQPSPWLAAVARVARTGNGRATPRDVGRLIAGIRAGINP